MVSQLQSYYLEEIVDKLIFYYEMHTNKKFNTRNLDDCIDFIKWLNGDVVFDCILNDRFGVDGAIINKGDNSFVIFVDENSLKSNVGVKKSAIGTIYRMLFYHIQSWVNEKNLSDSEKQKNRLVYPQIDGLTAEDILQLPEIKDDSIQKRIGLRKNNINK